MDLVNELVAATRKLGNNVSEQKYETRISFYREPRIRGENRIVAIERFRGYVKLHLPKNRSFVSYFEKLHPWDGAFSKNKRDDYTFLNHIDSEKKLKVAIDIIRQAYLSL